MIDSAEPLERWQLDDWYERVRNDYNYGKVQSWLESSLSRTKEGYRISLAIPGVQKEAIQVTISDGVLIVSGEKKLPPEEGQKLYAECIYGSFSRSFNLPSDTDTNRVSASLKDGILSIHVPLHGVHHPRAIAIVEESEDEMPQTGVVHMGPITVEIQPGSATVNEIESFLEGISELYRLVGGSGIKFEKVDDSGR